MTTTELNALVMARDPHFAKLTLSLDSISLHLLYTNDFNQAY